MAKKWTAKQRQAYKERLAREYNETLYTVYSVLKRKGVQQYGTGSNKLNVQDVVNTNVIPVKRIVHPTREHIKALKKFANDNVAQYNAIYHSFEKSTTTAKRYKEGTEEYRQRKQLQLLQKMAEIEKSALSKNKKNKRKGTQFSGIGTSTKDRLFSKNEVERAIKIITGYIRDLESVKLDFDIEYRDKKKYMIITKKRMKRLKELCAKLTEMLDSCEDEFLIFRAKQIEHLYKTYGAPSINHFTYVDKEIDGDNVQGEEIMNRLDEILNLQDNYVEMITGSSLEEHVKGVISEAIKWQAEVRRQAEEIARKSKGIT